MSKAGVVRIEHLEVKKSDIERVKKIFDVKDNAEAVRKAFGYGIRQKSSLRISSESSKV